MLRTCIHYNANRSQLFLQKWTALLLKRSCAKLHRYSVTVSASKSSRWVTFGQGARALAEFWATLWPVKQLPVTHNGHLRDTMLILTRPSYVNTAFLHRTEQRETVGSVCVCVCVCVCVHERDKEWKNNTIALHANLGETILQALSMCF